MDYDNVKKETVYECLLRAVSHFPACGHTEQSIKIVCEDWYNYFSSKSDIQFSVIFRNMMAEIRFFPVMSDFVNASSGVSRDGKEWIR